MATVKRKNPLNPQDDPLPAPLLLHQGCPDWSRSNFQSLVPRNSAHSSGVIWTVRLGPTECEFDDLEIDRADEMSPDKDTCKVEAEANHRSFRYFSGL